MSMKNVVHWVYMRFNRKYLVFLFVVDAFVVVVGGFNWYLRHHLLSGR